MTSDFSDQCAISFLRDHTKSTYFPIWEKDDEVTYYLYRGKLPQGFTDNLSNSVEFEIIDLKTKSIIGCSGLHSINWISRSCEIRVLIGDKLYWRRGYGRRSIEETLAYAFNVLNLNRVWLGVNSEHMAALKLYTKIGFVYEGVLRNEFYKHGRFYDITRMAMLRPEWLAQQKEI